MISELFGPVFRILVPELFGSESFLTYLGDIFRCRVSSFREVSVPECNTPDSPGICSRTMVSELYRQEAGAQLVSFLSCLEVFIPCVKSLNSVMVCAEYAISELLRCLSSRVGGGGAVWGL